MPVSASALRVDSARADDSIQLFMLRPDA